MDNLDVAIESWVALKKDMKTPVETKFITVLGTEIRSEEYALGGLCHVTYVTVLVGYEYV
jgi:hypothetical protein